MISDFPFFLLFGRTHFIPCSNGILFRSCTCNAFWGIPSIPRAQSGFGSETTRCGNIYRTLWVIPLKHSKTKERRPHKSMKKQSVHEIFDWTGKINFFGWNTTEIRTLCTASRAESCPAISQVEVLILTAAPAVLFLGLATLKSILLRYIKIKPNKHNYYNSKFCRCSW